MKAPENQFQEASSAALQTPKDVPLSCCLLPCSVSSGAEAGSSETSPASSLSDGGGCHWGERTYHLNMNEI
jgi:hypothetical protein